MSSIPKAKKAKSGPNLMMLAGGLSFTLLLVAVLGSGFGRDPHRIDTDALEGKPATIYVLENIAGEHVNLAEYIGKQWVVLNFWSTWCGPCKQEHPELVRAAELYPNVKWLGVVYRDETPKAAHMLASYAAREPQETWWNSPMAHLIDPSGAMSVDYGVTGVPETFFINPDGIVVKKFAVPIHRGDIQGILGPPTL